MNESGAAFSILLVDDEPQIHSAVKRCLRKEPYRIVSSENGSAALSVIERFNFQLFIVDLKMPVMDGLTLLRRIKEKNPDSDVFILSGTANIREAIEAVKAGALDFIEKPFHPVTLRNRIRHVYDFWLLERENERLSGDPGSVYNYRHFIGNNHAMLELKELISRAAVSREPVLIQGETGTGKELVAKALHSQSDRASGIFLTVDCSGISESLIESELFGHAKGAFTGATSEYSGLIRAAQGGVLFLDEIGELSLNVQAKLLRVIQEKTVRPVGKIDSTYVDVWIIAATNRNLKDAVAKGVFREDLYYRLSVIVLETIPLRDRLDDLPLLCRYFLKKFNTEASSVTEIGKEALEILNDYNWPGNVRELENVLRRAIAIGRNQIIIPEDLPEAIKAYPGYDGGEHGNDHYSLKAAEEKAIKLALKKAGGNRSFAAELLGIGEATLYRKIKLYNI